MNNFKKFALAAALVVCGVSGAQATEYGGTLTPVTLVDTTGGSLLWTFSDADFVETRSAGNDFGDYFIINVPDDELVTFSLTSADGSVGFDVFSFWFFGGEAIDFGVLGGANSFSAGTYALSTGVYELDVFGTFNADGGGYTGIATGTPPVPEPTGLALMLAGLGALGAALRRRTRQRA